MNKTKLAIGIVLIVIIAALVSATIWLYRGSVTDFKKKVFSKIPFPAVLIGRHVITANQVVKNFATAEKLFNQSGKEITTETKAQIYAQLINDQLAKQVSDKYGIVVSDKEINDEYKNLVDQYGAGDEQKFNQELQSKYGFTPEQFKSEIIKNDLTKSALNKWFNTQEDLNKPAYDKAKDLLNQINSGKSFDEIAMAYTQDEATKDFAGDSGFIKLDTLLPEFQEIAKKGELNKPTLVASRYGLHILTVSQKTTDPQTGEDLYNLKQIFFKTESFDKWFAEETNKIRVTKLLNF